MSRLPSPTESPACENKVLCRVLHGIGLRPLQSDQQLCAWHVLVKPSSTINLVASGSAEARRLVLVISTHVDDRKGAGEYAYRVELLKDFERRFGKL